MRSNFTSKEKGDDLTYGYLFRIGPVGMQVQPHAL
jgi:hypothetical protein